MTEHAGSCHCGAVRLTFRTARSPADWPLRVCTCTFCHRFGGTYTSDPTGSIVLHASRELRAYRFGQRTADFLFCPECGVYFGAAADLPGGRRAVLHVRVLDDVALDLSRAQPMDFDAESAAIRNERRLRHWTPLQIV